MRQQLIQKKEATPVPGLITCTHLTTSPRYPRRVEKMCCNKQHQCSLSQFLMLKVLLVIEAKMPSPLPSCNQLDPISQQSSEDTELLTLLYWQFMFVYTVEIHMLNWKLIQKIHALH